VTKKREPDTKITNDESNRDTLTLSQDIMENDGELKVDETLINNESIEVSIYDSSICNLTYSRPASDETFTSKKNIVKENISSEILIQDPATTINYENVANNFEYLNNFIERLKDESNNDSTAKFKTLSVNKINELKNTRSDSFTSNGTISSLDSGVENSLILNNGVETDSVNSLLNYSLDDNFSDIMFKFVDAISCDLKFDTIPLNWTEDITKKKKSFCNLLFENEIDKKSEWRSEVYNALKKRNNISYKDGNKFQKAVNDVIFKILIFLFL
jgi:hypothetical protein